MVFYNRVIDKRGLKNLIAWTFSSYGSARAAVVADKLKELGFRYATKAGVSISVDDLQVPPLKREMLESAEQEIRKTEKRYARGEITEVERFQKVIDTWHNTSDALKDEVVRNFRETNPLNSVYMMAFSGARGNLSQVRQLVGMRGLMADPQGEIIAFPIKTNFREGLTVTEYIISSYGARKGLVDTALRTADSGYLTRRLVDVSQDVIVREIDCGTDRSITLSAMTDGSKVVIQLGDRLMGRVLAQDVVDPNTKEVIAKRNQFINEALGKRIGTTVDHVLVRSPLTCDSARSVCQHCYGWSLAHGEMVNMGEAIGIIAAQSIGEPGTQLTMRTFHTGGVFTGEVAQRIVAEQSGKAIFDKNLGTRIVRTRHGDEKPQVESAGHLIVSKDGKKIKHNLPPGALLEVFDGETVEAGQILAEVPTAKLQKSTEKVNKEVASDLAGEVLFAPELIPEEKTDRQGNTTRIASRSGLLWVLSGEVYNLPPTAEPVVKNGDWIEAGSVLAETNLVTNSGGLVRLRPGSREIDIVTASVLLDQALVRKESSGGRDQYIVHAADGNRFSLKVTPGMKVQNNSVVAELIDDRYRTHSGGFIKYAGVEVSKGNRKNGFEVTQGGTLLWIPEETHEVNKDNSLLIVEDGQYVEAGTEIVKGIYCNCSGIVEVVQKNDILREVIVKPGELHLDLDTDAAMKIGDGQVVNPGTELLPGLTVSELRYCEFVDTTEGYGLLLRPVQEFTVAKAAASLSQGSINQQGGRQIELTSIQRIYYKDGERIKSVDGVNLLSTQMVLQITSLALTNPQKPEPEDGNSQISADIELVAMEDDPDIQRLQMVILESLVVRREMEGDSFGGKTQTRLLVEDGQQITKGAVVARTEIHSKESGVVRGLRDHEDEPVRRVLLVRKSDLLNIPCQEATVKVGDLIVAGSKVGAKAETPESGQVMEVTPTEVIVRLARPYRVSAQAILQIDDRDLVQRGDKLALLVYERPKTGDIIQGLPRIEELLEARKPKEACILCKRPGVAQVEYWQDETPEIKIIEDDGLVSDYPLSPGQNVLVADGQRVDAATPLTDGPANPHEILEIFFNYHIKDKGDYDSALIAFRSAQIFLVNQVQSVYQSQGIEIADKHIEVIVRQMTSKVRVDDGGGTTMLPGELVELRQIVSDNETMALTGGAPARFTPVLLGITKASLNTDSFISAASFQETTRVLTEAAIEGKSDWLRGLKENVIIGRLIPAGTGFNAYENGGTDQEDEQFQDPAARTTGIYTRSATTEKRNFRPAFNDEEEESASLAGESFYSSGDNMIIDDHSARVYSNKIAGKMHDEEE